MADLPKFPGAATVLWKGRTWNKVRAILKRWRPRAGNGLVSRETPDGTILSLSPDSGWSGAVTWIVDNNGSYNTLTFSYEAGVLVSVTAVGANTTATGAGSQNDRGSVSITTLVT